MTKAGTATANAAHPRETIPTVTKPPNYLDFLVALDEHISNDPLGYVQDWSGLHRIAQEGGLETPTLPQAARWTGQLYHHKYVTLRTLGLGTHNDPPAGDFTDQDLQRLREFEITPLGREEADRIRRHRREADADAVLGLRFPDLDRLGANDAQRRAVGTPWRQLRGALESEHWPVVIGSAKDLAEAACEVAIALTGSDPASNDDLPALVKKALQASSGGDAADDLSRSLISTTQRLAELRNDVGTGHGRGEQPEVSRRTGRLAASAALAVAEYVLSTTSA